MLFWGTGFGRPGARRQASCFQHEGGTGLFEESSLCEKFPLQLEALTIIVVRRKRPFLRPLLVKIFTRRMLRHRGQ